MSFLWEIVIFSLSHFYPIGQRHQLWEHEQWRRRSSAEGHCAQARVSSLHKHKYLLYSIKLMLNTSVTEFSVNRPCLSPAPLLWLWPSVGTRTPGAASLCQGVSVCCFFFVLICFMLLWFRWGHQLELLFPSFQSTGEPIRPIDPAAWVSHTAAMTGVYPPYGMSPSMSTVTSTSSSISSSIPETEREWCHSPCSRMSLHVFVHLYSKQRSHPILTLSQSFPFTCFP